MTARIALAVDNSEMSRELQNLLASAHYEVMLLTPGATAKDDSQFPDLDLAIIECCQDGADCLRMIRELRQELDSERIPIIVLNDQTLPEASLHVLNAGANLCLPWPIERAELLCNITVQLKLWYLQSELQRQLELNQALLSRLKIDLSLGQQVQNSFLPPQQLRMLNFNLDARFIPSGDLSGDYFDYRLVTPERLVIFLADVSGHGVASALLASRLKAFFDENYHRAHKPQLLMENLNRVMIELGEHYHIATAMFVNIDVNDTVMTYASAGHRPLYWLDLETGQHHAMPANGPALGMFSEYEIQEVHRSFLPGRNRLVAFTDGLVEFKLPDGTWHTEEQFCDEVMFPLFHEPIDKYVQSLLDCSRERNQLGHWDDDVSLLTIDF